MTTPRYSPDLFPADIPLPPLDGTEPEDDPKAVLKIVTGAWTWYVVERDGDRCYGLVVGHEIAADYFTVSELIDNGAYRDTTFTPESVRVLRARHGGDDNAYLTPVSSPEPPPSDDDLLFFFAGGNNTDDLDWAQLWEALD